MHLAEERSETLKPTFKRWNRSEVSIDLDPDMDAAMDALHVLPLSILPLKTVGLAKATMIKNARLESVVELFGGAETGSGQVRPEDLPDYFARADVELERDVEMLLAVGSLRSFDVFSLRSELRRIDIGFEDHGALTLSVVKRGELLEFMGKFTRPLLARIYGDGEAELGDLRDIMRLLANPDQRAAMRRLKTLARDLGIAVSEIPALVKQYGDVFLSISYYRKCLAEISREVPEFLGWMEEIRDTSLVRDSGSNIDMLNGIHHDFSRFSRAMKQRFQAFDALADTFWDEVGADTFRMFGATVTAQHVGMGAMLCGLTVKLIGWRNRFPRKNGTPTDRLEFLVSEIVPGLDDIRQAHKGLEGKAGLN